MKLKTQLFSREAPIQRVESDGHTITVSAKTSGGLSAELTFTDEEFRKIAAAHNEVLRSARTAS